MRQTLALFQQAQLICQIDEDVGICADPHLPTFSLEGHRWETPVSKISLGHRAQARHCAGLSNLLSLDLGQVGCMDQAPARVNFP